MALRNLLRDECLCVFVWIPWRQHVGKLPDPAAAVPLSDYRSEQLHAVELARSKTPTQDTHTHIHTSMQHIGRLEDHRIHTNTHTHTNG